jgi:poly(A) polymerase
VALMHDAGVLAQFLPQATRTDRLPRLVAAEATLDGLAINPMRRLAALLCVTEGDIDDVCARLRLSNAERAYLVSMSAQSVSREDPARRRAIHHLGAATFRDLVLLGWAKSGDDSGWSALLEFAAAWTPQLFPLSGADVLAAGIAPGPAVGKILQTIEAWWIDGDFSADKGACLARLDAEIA